VRELLKGKANVHRIPVNGQSSATGVAGTHGPKSWLGKKKWDVIHFNFGIWDAKLVPATGLPAVPHAQYEANLIEIAKRLQAGGTRVIFATTTPIPADLTTVPVPGKLDPKTRLFESIPERNALAVKAMQARGVAIDDLYTVILPRVKEFQRPHDVHFTPAGSALLAQSVADSIIQQLPGARR
jgi:lysophospholipase L1-like esterase